MNSEQKAAWAEVMTIDQGVLHGMPCFAGTRVPVQTLIDFLESGETIDDFLRVYPYIPRERIHAFLDLSKSLAVEQLTCASS